MATSRPRVSSRKSVAPLSLTIPPPKLPLPPLPSPGRHRGRHVPLHPPSHLGLFTVAETEEDDDRCPSWYSQDTYSPSVDSNAVRTPEYENDDPFANQFGFAARHPAEFEINTKSSSGGRSPPRRPARIAVSPYSLASRLPLRSPLRSPMTPTPRPLRMSMGSASSYPRSPSRTPALLPALPIVPQAAWEQVNSPTVSTPQSPLTPTTPAHTGANELVSALNDLLTDYNTPDLDEDMFADADEGEDCPSPGQFADAPSPQAAPSSPERLDVLPELPVFEPITPPRPTEAVNQPAHYRTASGERLPPGPGFEGDHTVLQQMSATARAEAFASRVHSLRSVPSLPSLSSSSSLSSASSLASLSCSSLSSLAATPTSSVGPASARAKPRVSSRPNPIRSALPSTWTRPERP